MSQVEKDFELKFIKTVKSKSFSSLQQTPRKIKNFHVYLKAVYKEG